MSVLTRRLFGLVVIYSGSNTLEDVALGVEGFFLRSSFCCCCSSAKRTGALRVRVGRVLGGGGVGVALGFFAAAGFSTAAGFFFGFFTGVFSLSVSFSSSSARSRFFVTFGICLSGVSFTALSFLGSMIVSSIAFKPLVLLLVVDILAAGALVTFEPLLIVPRR